MTKKESDPHTKKREAALRANLLKRKMQARARNDKDQSENEKSLNNDDTLQK